VSHNPSIKCLLVFFLKHFFSFFFLTKLALSSVEHSHCSRRTGRKDTFYHCQSPYLLNPVCQVVSFSQGALKEVFLWLNTVHVDDSYIVYDMRHILQTQGYFCFSIYALLSQQGEYATTTISYQHIKWNSRWLQSSASALQKSPALLTTVKNSIRMVPCKDAYINSMPEASRLKTHSLEWYTILQRRRRKKRASVFYNLMYNIEG